MRRMFSFLALAMFVVMPVSFSVASGEAKQEEAKKVKSEEVKKPYTVSADGKIDWYTFSGYRRYHAECHVCHGPDGLGSSFAPNLLESVTRLGYAQYLDITINGRTNVSQVAQNRMPGFGTNPNVMCFIDDIYAYLIARADGVLGRGRPAKKQPKPAEAKERDAACLGG